MAMLRLESFGVGGSVVVGPASGAVYEAAGLADVGPSVELVFVDDVFELVVVDDVVELVELVDEGVVVLEVVEDDVALAILNGLM
jgi:hypothetical protein